MRISNSSTFALVAVMFFWIFPPLVFVTGHIPITPFTVFALSLYSSGIGFLLFSKHRQITAGDWAEFGTKNMTRLERQTYLIGYALLASVAILTITLQQL
jgi:hypothetical protein